MKLRLAIEGFQTPSHLPLIAGIEQGWFAEAGLEIEPVAPADAVDGLDAVAAGEIELACSTPLDMLAAPRPGLRALGCFFETEGGLLILNAAMERLAAGDPIRLAVPVAGGLQAAVAVEILRRWFEAHHPSIGLDQVRVSAAGFRHIDNLVSGFDAVWPCFANFEGIEAERRQIDARFLSTHAVDLENTAALELFTGGEFLARHPDVVERVTEVVSRAARSCIEHPMVAREIWYRHVGESPDAVTDAILEDSCARFVTPVVRNRERWRAAWTRFDDLQLGQLTRAEFEALYD